MSDHGTRKAYRSGCRCLACRLANSVYWAAWHAKKAKGQTPDHAIVKATQARRQLASLLTEGFSRCELAAALGLSQLPDWRRHNRMRASTVRKIQRVYRLAQGQDHPAQ